MGRPWVYGTRGERAKRRRKIREAVAAGVTRSKAAELFKVSAMTVRRACQGAEPPERKVYRRKPCPTCGGLFVVLPAHVAYCTPAGRARPDLTAAEIVENVRRYGRAFDAPARSGRVASARGSLLRKLKASGVIVDGPTGLEVAHQTATMRN